MLGPLRKRCANIKTTLGERLVFAGLIGVLKLCCTKTARSNIVVYYSKLGMNRPTTEKYKNNFRLLLVALLKTIPVGQNGRAL